MKHKFVLALSLGVFAIAMYLFLSYDKWEKYYSNKMYQPAHDIIIMASEKFHKPGTAIDLGCGVGNDVAYLLKHGWKVWALDSQPKAIQLLKERKDITSFDTLVAKIAKFDEGTIWDHLPSADLVYASLSLPFLDEKTFKETWGHIQDKIKTGGRFAGHFFGVNYKGFTDREKREMTFLSIEEIRNILNGFDIEFFDEHEEDSKSGTGCPIHAHIFEVIARKR